MPIDEPERVADAAEGRHRRTAGRLAGVLACGAALAAIPAHELFGGPDLPGFATPFTLAGLGLGVLCLAAPWERLPGWVLHAVPVTATAFLALAVAGAGQHGFVFAPYWFLLVVFVGFAFRSRPAIAFHVALASVGTAAPALYDPALEPEALAQTVIRIPTLMAVTVVVVLLRERLEAGQHELRELVQRDPLTGVGNYRTLYERLGYELTRHARTNRPLAVLLLDLDEFKQVNEQFGHLIGDRLLREVGRRLRDTVRAQDTVVRQGGDEFAVLAPETDEEDAAVLAARIEDALAGVSVAGQRLGVSVGWALFPRDATDRQSLLAAADLAQHRHKTERRLKRIIARRAAIERRRRP